jgi:hypothetical protein
MDDINILKLIYIYIYVCIHVYTYVCMCVCKENFLCNFARFRINMYYGIYIFIRSWKIKICK